MRFQSLPKGTKLYTPSGRLAEVDYCEDGRVHVKYIDRYHLRAETGCYPINLVLHSDLVKAGTECDDRSPHYLE
jgi:hypothetical protein